MAAKGGYEKSFDLCFYMDKEGFITHTKDECASAMSAYQKIHIHDESRSAKRDKAEADIYKTLSVKKRS